MTSKVAKVGQVSVCVLKFEDVFSYPEFTLRGVKDWNGVSMLGRKNIAVLVSKARSHEKMLTESVARAKDKQGLLKGKTGDDFKEMAKGFENPTLTDIGVPSDSWSKDPEPLDQASKDRKEGATTFNVCGWCKHTGGGSCRYGYHITTRCDLLRGNSHEVRFNTPCLLHNKTAEEIAVLVEGLNKEVSKLLERREKVREGIKLLQHLKEGAPDKPYLMSLRPHDHFNVGDDLMVYVGQWGEKKSEHNGLVKEGVWVPAIVVYGYRHHDGCVSYQTMFPVHTNMSYLEGRGGGAGMSRPEALLRSDFNYLQEASKYDIEFFLMWLDNIDDHLEGLDRYKFRRDLSTGMIAHPPTDWQAPTDEIQVKSVRDAEHVLQMLDASLFKTEHEIRQWAKMQLRHVHPDRLTSANENVKSYAARQTRAVYAARDLLIARLGNR